MKRLIPLVACLLTLIPLALRAQVGINTTGASPDPSAMLDIQSTNRGMLVPRMDSTQRNTISSPANGLLVFDTDYQTFWFYEGSEWRELATDAQLKRETTLNQEDFFPGRVRPDFSCLQIRNSLTASGYTGAVAVKGDSAFVVLGGQDSLLIMDISDPLAPQPIDSIPLNGNFGVSAYLDIEVVGDYAYVVDVIWSEIAVVDLSGGSANTVARYYVDSPLRIKFKGSTAYLISELNNDLIAADFSNPASPSSAGTLPLNSSIQPYDLALSENEAYVVGTGSNPNFQVYDISTPGSPSFLSSKTLNFDAYGIDIQESLAYVVGTGTDNFKVVDISEPSNPVFRDSLTIPGMTGFGNNSLRVWAEGLYAYVIEPISNRLVIIDIANPDDLSIAASLNFSSSPTDLFIQGNLGFFTDISGNLHTIQLSCFPSNNVAVNPLTGDFIPVPNTSAGIDSTDELQSLTKTGNLISLSLGGGTVIDSVIDDDADPANEIQSLSLSGSNLSISGGNTIALPPDQVNDADADPGNELQSLSLVGYDLSLSDGNTVSLPLSDVLTDTDGDTRVLVEENSDEDKIRFSTSGTERLQLGESGLLSEGTFVASYAGAIPDSGAGTRMMWVPQKAAFRVGNVIASQWDLNNIGDYSFVGGGNSHTVSGSKSFTGGGEFNTVSGENAAIVGGGFHEVSAPRAVVLGGRSSSISFGDNGALVGGEFNRLLGESAFIGGGKMDSAYGAWSGIVGGQFNKATGAYAFIGGGIGIQAEGVAAFAGGIFNQAHSYAETVFGLYAAPAPSPTANSIVATDRLFVIGNGTGTSSRSNALTLLKNGNMGLGESLPQHTLEVDGEIAIVDGADTEGMVLRNAVSWTHFNGSQTYGTGGAPWLIASREGDSESAGIYGDGNAITLWNPGDGVAGQPQAYVYLLDEDFYDNDGNPYDNGALRAYLNSSGLWQVSDGRKKEGIRPITGAISAIEQIGGYRYSLKVNEVERKKGQKPVPALGVVAQDLAQVLPEAVNSNAEGEYWVNYAQITPLLLEGIKEQQQTIRQQQAVIDELLERVEALEQQ